MMLSCLQVDVSFKRLMKLNKPELPWALVGCAASAVLGAQMPAFAIALSSVIAVYYEPVRLYTVPHVLISTLLSCSLQPIDLLGLMIRKHHHRIPSCLLSHLVLLVQLNEMEGDAAKWSGIFVAIGVGTFLASIAQSSCFGLMGAKLARRVRELTFGSLLRQVGLRRWRRLAALQRITVHPCT